MDIEKLQHLSVKIKDLMSSQSSKAIIDIEKNSSMVTVSQYASYEDTEQVIATSRDTKDKILKLKSEAVIAIDNIAKDIPQNKF